MSTQTKTAPAVALNLAGSNAPTAGAFAIRLETLRDSALDYVATASNNASDRRYEDITELVNEGKIIYEQMYRTSIKDSTADASTDLAGDKKSLSRWASQCLAHYAYFADLEYKLKRLKISSGPTESLAMPAAERYFAAQHQSNGDVRYLATSWELLTQLNALSQADAASRPDPYESVSQLHSAIYKMLRPLSVELAVLQACLTYWIHAKRDHTDQALLFEWKESWLPVGHASEGDQHILVHLVVGPTDDAPVGYLSANDRKYNLDIAPCAGVKIVNAEGFKVATDAGRVEIEWELAISSSVLQTGYETMIHVEATCVGLNTASMPHSFHLKQCQNITPDLAGCDFNNIDIESLSEENADQVLLAALESTVSKVLGITKDEFEGKVVFADIRCGRFLNAAVGIHGELAKRLIGQVVHSMAQSKWWYISRPQISAAVEALVQPGRGSGVDMIIEKYMERKFQRSAKIGDGEPYELSVALLVEILALQDEKQVSDFSSMARASLRSKSDCLRNAELNLLVLINELVSCEILSKTETCYDFSNEFVRSWVVRQSLS